jgi:hypothetical protein
MKAPEQLRSVGEADKSGTRPVSICGSENKVEYELHLIY